MPCVVLPSFWALAAGERGHDDFAATPTERVGEHSPPTSVEPKTQEGPEIHGGSSTPATPGSSGSPSASSTTYKSEESEQIREVLLLDAADRDRDKIIIAGYNVVPLGTGQVKEMSVVVVDSG